MLSENSNKSPQVRREAGIAVSCDLAMIGAFLQNFSLDASLKYCLATIQLSKFVDDSEDEDGLAQKIAEYIIESEEKALLEAEERKRIQAETFLSQTADYVSRGLEADITKILDSSKIAVLYGAGGMGKTCLAVNYYMQDKGHYGSVLFVNAETPQDLFRSLGMIENGDLKNMKALVFTVFEKTIDRLLEDRELIHKYGVQKQDASGKQMEYTIPAIVCVSIKNSAILKKGYQNVTSLVGNRRTLGDLVRVQMESLRKDRENQGLLFAEILQIVSFLNGTKIHRDFLFEAVSALKKVQGQDVSKEQFDSCLDFYNSKISLLNSVNEGAAKIFTIHRNFQKEINDQIEGRREIKEALMQVFMKKVHPHSYYGTHTLADTGGG